MFDRDSYDERIRKYRFRMEKDNLGLLLEYPLPEGYQFVFYQPGDKQDWIEIEISACECKNQAQGEQFWNQYFENKDEELKHRMIFVENQNHEKVATVTAFYDIKGEDLSGAGWLHWVAVKKEYQGKGLSRPLISKALKTLRKLGYDHAMIPTKTTAWVACKLYLDFGFRPTAKNAKDSYEGWCIIKTLTNHPALSMFEMTDKIYEDDEV